jgi:hypothetical protein
MTPKEKAQHIIMSFMELINPEEDDSWNTNSILTIYSIELKRHRAKKCALFLVNQVRDNGVIMTARHIKRYWDDVKREVETYKFNEQ